MENYIERPIFKYFPLVVCATDEKTRFNASSGGVVTTIIKYLFDHQQVNCAISFKFDNQNYFQPEIIYKFSDYNISGSIYHEIDLYNFLKNNINHINKSIVITCTPCQVLPIRRLLKENNIKSLIISFVCSSQLTKKATDFLLSYLKIKPQEILKFQYRGDGWPGGIKIVTVNKVFKISNLNSVWYDIFHSTLFTLKRCFFCQDTFGMKADLTVADPWLEPYIKNEKVGQTVVLPHNERGREVIDDMIKQRYIQLTEQIKKQDFINSQYFTCQKKFIWRNYYFFYGKVLNLLKNKIYINFLFKRFHRQHTRILEKLTIFLWKLSNR